MPALLMALAVLAVALAMPAPVQAADSSTFDWTQISTTTPPPARAAFRMAYDSARDRLVLFGGHGGTFLQDTWEFDGLSWSEKTPVNKPSARRGMRLVYDSARQRTVLFGGNASDVHSNETWEWDGTNWAQLNPANSPSSRDVYAAAYDSVRGLLVQFGGNNGAQLLWGTLEYIGSGWNVLDLTPRPSERQNHAMAYDVARRCTVLFGGDDGAAQQDTWEYRATPSAGPLAFSRGPALLGPGSLTITADYDLDLATNVTPTLTFPTVGAYFTVNSTARNGTNQFVFSVTVGGTTPAAGTAYTASVQGARDTSGNDQGAARTQSGTVDTAGPTVALTYNKNTACVSTGQLVITAAFGEACATTPTLTLEAPGTADDVTATSMSGAGTLWTFTARLGAAAGGRRPSPSPTAWMARAT